MNYAHNPPNPPYFDDGYSYDDDELGAVNQRIKDFADPYRYQKPLKAPKNAKPNQGQRVANEGLVQSIDFSDEALLQRLANAMNEAEKATLERLLLCQEKNQAIFDYWQADRRIWLFWRRKWQMYNTERELMIGEYKIRRLYAKVLKRLKYQEIADIDIIVQGEKDKVFKQKTNANKSRQRGDTTMSKQHKNQNRNDNNGGGSSFAYKLYMACFWIAIVAMIGFFWQLSPFSKETVKRGSPELNPSIEVVPLQESASEQWSGMYEIKPRVEEEPSEPIVKKKAEPAPAPAADNDVLEELPADFEEVKIDIVETNETYDDVPAEPVAEEPQAEPEPVKAEPKPEPKSEPKAEPKADTKSKEETVTKSKKADTKGRDDIKLSRSPNTYTVVMGTYATKEEAKQRQQWAEAYGIAMSVTAKTYDDGKVFYTVSSKSMSRNNAFELDELLRKNELPSRVVEKSS